jgi:hypothetical protein
MLKKLPGKSSFLILTTLFIVGITFLKHPFLKAKYFGVYREELFNQFKNELSLNQFDPERYWEFREKFSNGNFTTEQTNIDFLSTFKISNVDDKQATILLFYSSDHLNSVDGLLKGPFSQISEQIKQDYPGEILVENDKLICIKIDNKNYVLAFIEPITTMMKVNGMFDYRSNEHELIKDHSWYNISKIQL